MYVCALKAIGGNRVWFESNQRVRPTASPVPMVVSPATVERWTEALIRASPAGIACSIRSTRTGHTLFSGTIYRPIHPNPSIHQGRVWLSGLDLCMPGAARWEALRVENGPWANFCRSFGSLCGLLRAGERTQAPSFGCRFQPNLLFGCSNHSYISLPQFK
jgi:hypothetical protein